MVTLTWHAGKYKVHKLHQRYILSLWGLCTLYLQKPELPAVTLTWHALVEFMYLVFTRMPGESYHRQLGSLLSLCYIF